MAAMGQLAVDLRHSIMSLYDVQDSCCFFSGQSINCKKRTGYGFTILFACMGLGWYLVVIIELFSSDTFDKFSTSNPFL
jgi:hypothetical protein